MKILVQQFERETEACIDETEVEIDSASFWKLVGPDADGVGLYAVDAELLSAALGETSLRLHLSADIFIARRTFDEKRPRPSEKSTVG